MAFDKLCGTDIGIYHIEYLCDNKDTDGHKKYHVKCRCCGFESDMRLHNIKAPKQCKHLNMNGNYTIQQFKWTNIRLRNIFSDMKDRCYNSNNKNYDLYGAKGVRVASEWIDNPYLFEQWALNNGYEDSLTIDRMDSNKDYCPENCRWITIEENSRRAGKVNWITVNGLTMTGRQWSEYLNKGINYINRMIRDKGMDYTINYIQQAINQD